MEKKIIYMDNAATTKVAKEVVEAMLPYYDEKFYNPSSVYDKSQSVKEDLEKANQEITHLYEEMAGEDL